MNIIACIHEVRMQTRCRELCSRLGAELRQVRLWIARDWDGETCDEWK